MLVRAIALSIALLIGVGAFIPLSTEFASAKKIHNHGRKREWRGVKKYSKRWWQLYRAQERRKTTLAVRRRALRLHQLRLAEQRQANAPGETAPSQPQTRTSRAKTVEAPVEKTVAAVLPSGEPAPAGWHTSQASTSELEFRVDNPSGDQIGSASISVVGPAAQGGSSAKSLGGVATSALRRDVIDRMIRENGWVLNDYKKDVNGQPVYVVVGQSQAKNGALQTRMFYFTEVDGRIYSVATNAGANDSERIAEESEKVINSLKAHGRATQRAAVKE